jgi:hypothetical protein
MGEDQISSGKAWLTDAYKDFQERLNFDYLIAFDVSDFETF